MKINPLQLSVKLYSIAILKALQHHYCNLLCWFRPIDDVWRHI